MVTPFPLMQPIPTLSVIVTPGSLVEIVTVNSRTSPFGTLLAIVSIVSALYMEPMLLVPEAAT